MKILELKFADIINLISHDIQNIASIMHAKQLIPMTMLGSVTQVTGRDNNTKATELMQLIIAQVQLNSKMFDVFLDGLEEAGDYTTNLVESLRAQLKLKGQSSVHSDICVNAYEVLSHLKWTDSKFMEKIPKEKN